MTTLKDDDDAYFDLRGQIEDYLSDHFDTLVQEVLRMYGNEVDSDLLLEVIYDTWEDYVIPSIDELPIFRQH